MAVSVTHIAVLHITQINRLKAFVIHQASCQALPALRKPFPVFTYTLTRVLSEFLPLLHKARGYRLATVPSAVVNEHKQYSNSKALIWSIHFRRKVITT
jgi:hypothetical protein